MTLERTTFGVIRHAQTEWNRERRIQGWSDSPLTLEGERQAEGWGAHLQTMPWTLVLASDIGRALATARIVNRRLGLPLLTDHRLRELDWGQWTGKTVRQLRGEVPDIVAAQERAGWDFQAPGGGDPPLPARTQPLRAAGCGPRSSRRRDPGRDARGGDQEPGLPPRRGLDPADRTARAAHLPTGPDLGGGRNPRVRWGRRSAGLKRLRL